MPDIYFIRQNDGIKMSAKNGKLGKKKNTMKNVWKKRENGKSAARMRPYLVFETWSDGKAEGKQKKISPFRSKCLQKSGKWERRAGKCGKKRNKKKRHEGVNPYVSFNFGSGY